MTSTSSFRSKKLYGKLPSHQTQSSKSSYERRLPSSLSHRNDSSSYSPYSRTSNNNNNNSSNNALPPPSPTHNNNSSYSRNESHHYQQQHHNHYSYHHRSTSSSYSSSSIYHGSSSYPSEQPSQPSQPSLQPNNTSTVSSSLNVNHSPQKTLFETPTKPIQIPVFAPTYEETWTHCKVEGQRLREAEVKLTESVRKSQIDLDKASWELKKVIHQTALATRQIEILFSNNEKEVEALNKLAEKEIAVNKGEFRLK
ncbi:16355_t:CDS:2 [Entrophospora sp. SA101]|nr:16355_t:CDS:2 [Entrophospora sp. SA101]